MAGGGMAFAQGAAPPVARIVDVHHHILPPAWMSVAGAQVLRDSPAPEQLRGWTPERDLDDMDRAGVAMAVTSISTPGLWFGDATAARTLARACNEYAANLVRTYPTRFRSFAALPLPDVPGTLTEIGYAFDTLHVAGVGMLTSYGDKWLGDPAFDTVFAALNARKAVVFVHPTVPNCCQNVQPGIPSSLEEFLFDTARCVTSLLFSGTLTRYPDVRFIFTHGGGATASIYNRLNGYAGANKDAAAAVPGGVPAALRTLYFEIAGSVTPPTMNALMALVPTSHILFGSDHPFVPFPRTVTGMTTFGFRPDDLDAIASGNARRLLAL